MRSRRAEVSRAPTIELPGIAEIHRRTLAGGFLASDIVEDPALRDGLVIPVIHLALEEPSNKSG